MTTLLRIKPLYFNQSCQLSCLSEVCDVRIEGYPYYVPAKSMQTFWDRKKKVSESPPPPLISFFWTCATLYAGSGRPSHFSLRTLIQCWQPCFNSATFLKYTSFVYIYPIHPHSNRPYALTSHLHNNDAMLGVKTCRAARTCCAGRAHWRSASQSVRGPGPARRYGMQGLARWLHAWRWRTWQCLVWPPTHGGALLWRHMHMVYSIHKQWKSWVHKHEQAQKYRKIF